MPFLPGMMFGWGVMGLLNYFFMWSPALYPVMFDVVLAVVGGFLIFRYTNKQ